MAAATSRALDHSNGQLTAASGARTGYSDPQVL